MKAILEFNLPGETYEHKVALDGAKWKSVCFEFDRWLRSIEKHQDQKTLDVSEVRARLHGEISESGLSLDD